MFTAKALKPKPFVKWAGGKRQLVDVLKRFAPREYNTYIEPFVGGGALLFELMPERAIISDINEELINAYLVIRDKVEELIDSLKRHRNDKEYFYKVRALNPKELPPVGRASRFIFLNKTCYNGLYRENSKGEFNVPFGRYKNPKIVDEENLRAISEYLRNAHVEIINGDYKHVCRQAKRGDFVYLDPPYYPYSKTASFTKYSRFDFSAKDQEELALVFRELDKKGCKVMLSNSNTGFIKELYREYRIVEVSANRFINCKPERRKKAKLEILVLNYF